MTTEVLRAAGHAVGVFQSDVDPERDGDNARPFVLTMTDQAYEEMGKPAAVTVTVEPAE